MNNPFNKLKVHRDDEDVDQVLSQTKATTTPSNLFPNKEEKKPKKKVRPEEKKETVEVKDENDNVGFEVVGKQKKQKQTNEDYAEQGFEEKPGKRDAPPRFHQKRSEQTVKQGTGQRVFDRHVSGTGRGKEIKKDGRGGKYTWEGKPREIVEYDNTDYLFNKVLKNEEEAPKYEKRQYDNNYERYGKYDRKDKYAEKTEEKVEAKVEANAEAKVEEKQEVVPETTEDGKVNKKKLKKGEVNPDEDEKNKLIIPENAMTLKDYKEKSAKITTNTVKTTPIKVDLEVLAKDEDEHVISIPTTKVGGKKGKKKEKGIDAQEVELNKLVGSTLGYEDSSDRQRKPYQKYPKNYN